MKILGRGLAVVLLLAALSGISAGAPHEITPWKDNKAGAVSVTFDDGSISHFTVGVPALNARGFRGTFFIVTDYADNPQNDPDNIMGSWDNWRTAAAQGHEIASHTKSHANAGLDALTPTQLQEEVQGSKAVIDSRITTQTCLTFAYPFGIGATSPSVTSVVRNNYIWGRGVTFGMNEAPYDFYNVRTDFPDTTASIGSTLEREIDRAAQERKWLVLGFHRLDGLGYGPITEARFLEVLDHLNSQNQNLWVGTFGSVGKYIREREAAALTPVSASGNQIILTLTSALDASIYNEPLTLRSEVPTGWSYVEARQGSRAARVHSVLEGVTRVVYTQAVPGPDQITLTDITGTDPRITGIDPPFTAAGGPDFPLTVTGANFAEGSLIQWNGAPQGDTTYVSANELRLAVKAADIATGGTAAITVVNPGTPGLVSNAMGFQVRNPAPYPTLILSPAEAWAGGGDFTLTVSGTGTGGFINGSQIRWNGAYRATTFLPADPPIHPYPRLQAALTAIDSASAGNNTVSVYNPPPGGGTVSATFTVQNLRPVLNTPLIPAAAVAGTTGFTLTVDGSHFIEPSVVRWNGSDRVTHYASSSRLTVDVLASDIASAGIAAITVFNPPPGGGKSNALSFPINNPAPSLLALGQSFVRAGGPPFTLAINGAGFVNGSVVNWNGSPRATRFISATRLQADITAADIASAGMVSLEVFSPAPGGGTSNALSLEMKINIWLPLLLRQEAMGAFHGR